MGKSINAGDVLLGVVIIHVHAHTYMCAYSLKTPYWQWLHVGNKHFNDEYFGSEWALETNSLSSRPGLALASSVALGKLFKPLCDGLPIKWG